ncbi:hypothetical protein Tco_0837702 [Tanacetum coccineum]
MTGQLSTPPPNFNQPKIPDPKTAERQSVIEGYISALKTLCKDKACYELIKPKLLDFSDEISDDDEIAIVKKNKEKEMSANDELSEPFKAASKCPFTKRIINFTAPNHRMPTNAKIYNETSDPADHITRFTGMGNSTEWPMPEICQVETLDCSVSEAKERVEVVEVPGLVLESPERPPRLPNQNSLNLPSMGHHRSDQPAASLVPGLPKPMCHRTLSRC